MSWSPLGNGYPMQVYGKKNQAEKNIAGTGFGGNKNDSSLLRKQIKDAEKKSIQHDKTLIQNLQNATKSLQLKLRRKGAENSPPVNFDEEEQQAVEDVKDILRGQVPNEWVKRCTVYTAALSFCKVFAQDLNLLASALGDEKAEDEISLLTSIQLFAKQAAWYIENNGKPSNAFISSSSSSVYSKKVREDNKVNDMTSLALQVCQEIEETASKAKRTGKISISLLDDDDEDGDILAVTSLQEEETKVLKSTLNSLRFEIVDELPSHAFAAQPQKAGFDMRKVFKELMSYTTTLPLEHGSSIFVRAMNGRLDLLRAMITGPEDTPYANGVFFFDIFLPSSYPSKPPQVKIVTTGGGIVRFNPNLYACGKVCLSLLGTWPGPGWISGSSTLLQVLISIQSLILVPDPYFNEPGYSNSRNTPQGNKQSEQYNSDIRLHTLRVAIYDHLVNKKFPYPEFKEVLQRHFSSKKGTILHQIEKWRTLDKTHRNKNIIARQTHVPSFLPPHLAALIHNKAITATKNQRYDFDQIANETLKLLRALPQVSHNNGWGATSIIPIACSVPLSTSSNSNNCSSSSISSKPKRKRNHNFASNYTTKSSPQQEKKRKSNSSATVIDLIDDSAECVTSNSINVKDSKPATTTKNGAKEIVLID